MAKYLTLFLAGSLFGLGIAISGMANPAKVANFFDLAGTFDPSLIFVMMGAIPVAAVGYRLVFSRMEAPAYDASFHVPARSNVDARLIAGSATFGIGWGIAGFCPGGAIPALGLGDASAFAFILAMAVGMAVARAIDRMRASPAGAF